MRLVLAPWEWFTEPSGGSYWRKPGGDYSGGCLDLRSSADAGTAGPTPAGLGLFAYDTLPVGIQVAADLGDDPLRAMRPAERNALADALGLARAAMPGGPLAAVLAEHVLGAVSDPTGQARVKPLRMNRLGAEFHLGGFGRVWTAGLDQAHPNFTRTLQVRRADYARERASIADLRAAAIALGLDPDAAETRKLRALRKWTGWDMLALYGRMDATLLADLVPLAHLADGYEQPATTLTESWPTDSTTISTGQDQPWNEDSGDAQVTGGALAPVNASHGRCTANLSSDNHQHDATGTSGADFSSAGINARKIDSTVQTSYQAHARRQTGTKRFLTKVVAGTFTNLATNGTDPGASYALQVKADGSSISGLVGAVALGPITDTDITGNLQCGYTFLTGAGVPTLDAHTMQDIAAATTFPGWIGAGWW